MPYKYSIYIIYYNKNTVNLKHFLRFARSRRHFPSQHGAGFIFVAKLRPLCYNKNVNF